MASCPELIVTVTMAGLLLLAIHRLISWRLFGQASAGLAVGFAVGFAVTLAGAIPGSTHG